MFYNTAVHNVNFVVMLTLELLLPEIERSNCIWGLLDDDTEI